MSSRVQRTTRLQRRAPKRSRRARWLVAVVLLLAMAIGGGLSAFAQADQAAADRVPRGVVIGGVPVGHLRSADAVARLEKEIGAPARRSVRVRLEGQTYRLSAQRAGVDVDLRSLVQRVVDSGREGNFLERGWRELTKEEVDARAAVRINVDGKAVKRFVAGLAAKVAQPAVNAQLTMTVDSISVSESKEGQRLAGTASLEQRIERAFTRSGASRRLTARTETVAPTQTAEQVWAAHPTVVTVAHDAKRVTVFEHGEATVTYHVAVGDPKYPTPYGQFSVQTMQKDPPWNVPNSEWAGDLAGQTIPGGDPRNPLVARWIGFNGSVGFHGTKDLASLGRAASHGCVRMDPKDVKDLFTRLKVGTPVIVGD